MLEMPQENQLRQGLRELQPLLSLPVMADCGSLFSTVISI